ncbi:MAG: divergent polysaccharide deacetylase family protein, partial [bacterium]
VGYSISELEPFLDLEIPLTIAVLPHLDSSREAVDRAREAGLDVILHLPMEPTVDIDPGPGAILTGQSGEEMRRRVNRAMESVPGVIGANNHMGSAATADARVMRTVIDELAANDLFFLDSRTSAHSQVEGVSATLQLPYMRRDFFVDHDRDADAMRAALSRGIERASEDGVAIVIGHVQTSALPAIIEEAAREAERRGVRFEGLSHYRDTVFLADRAGIDGSGEVGR